LSHPIFATEIAETFEENLLKSHFSLWALWLIKSAMYARAWYTYRIALIICHISHLRGHPLG
jgi:hypothetical protein